MTTEATPTPRSYTVVGAGAVGLLYGTRLAAAGHEVRWLVRSGVDDLRRHGIEVHSQGDVFRIAPADVVVAADGADLPASDVVLVATKTTANDRLGELVGGACGDGATVAVFQNGLGAEEQRALLTAYRRTVPAAAELEQLAWLVRMVRLMAWFWALLGEASADDASLYATYVAELGERLRQD